MSLVATIRSAVDVAFAQVGDLARSITVTRAAEGAYDPNAGSVTPDASSGLTFTTTAVEEKLGTEQVNGVTIRTGDLVVYIRQSEATFAPDATMSVTYAGETYSIEGVREHAQTLYELHLRRTA